MAALSALVYSGDGAGIRSVQTAVTSLRAALSPNLRVRSIHSNELLRGGWEASCAVLVMPGGADLPYCRVLNGAGNSRIKEYVSNGGAYLGLCAGAYYACQRVEFEPGTSLEVVGERELGFYPGVARGSIQPGFHYSSEAGAGATLLKYLVPKQVQRTFGDTRTSSNSHLEDGFRVCRDYCNGGPCFSSTELNPSGVKVLATYPEHENAVAAVRCDVGRGVAVLCGTHPELGHSWLDAACSAEAVASMLHEPKESENVQQLVEHAAAVRAKLCESQPLRTLFWLSLLYEAGLGAFLTHEAAALRQV